MCIQFNEMSSPPPPHSRCYLTAPVALRSSGRQLGATAARSSVLPGAAAGPGFRRVAHPHLSRPIRASDVRLSFLWPLLVLACHSPMQLARLLCLTPAPASSRVRHEAGEALGAICTDECLPPLLQHKQDATLEASRAPAPAARLMITMISTR